MAKHNLYVLTGGPCTGKTSIGRQLAHNAYLVLPESARTVIQAQTTAANPILPTTDPTGFQLEVLRKQEQLEDFVKELGDPPHGGPVFLDRSKIDNLAYCRVFDIQPPTELMRACMKAVDDNLYSRVYLMDRIPYVQDAERTEDAELAKKIHHAIADVYQELGFDLYRVEDMGGPEPRAAYIEGTLEEQVYSLGAPMPSEEDSEKKIFTPYDRYSILEPAKYGADDGRSKNSPRLPNGMTLDEFASKVLRGDS